MFKDSIVLGVLAGFAGNIFKEAIAWSFHYLGYLRYTFVHIAAGTFVPQEFLDSPVSLTMGFIADWIIAGFMGVIIVQLIRRTGNDYPIFKAIGTSALLYVLFYGILMALDVTRASLLTPLPNLLLIFPHLIFGLFAGWFIKRYNVVVS